MNSPRLGDFNRRQIEKFNELRILLKKGRIPASLINPVLIKEHNDRSPDVAKIRHSTQEVCLEALFIQYAFDGVAIRKSFRDGIYTPTATKVEDVDDTDVANMSRHDRVMNQGSYDVIE